MYNHVRKVAVVGAGIFGCSIALELDKEGYEVVLFEKEIDILLKASKNNHNRIHFGYHYPRSSDTARQSLEGFLSFIAYYGDCVRFGFNNYYAIARDNSFVSPSEFREFCNEVGIGYKMEYPSKELLNRDLIAESYLVEEPVYDWSQLQTAVKERLKNSRVNLKLNSDFLKEKDQFDFVVNCTYFDINDVSKLVNVQEVKFKRQDVIIPIFRSNVQPTGLTVMDGPFCSVMPRGFNRSEFLLYHAKYSVIQETTMPRLVVAENVEESVERILQESISFFPFLKNAEVLDFWRAYRAIPINNNDERLSEVITYLENPNIVTVFSGKVSTSIKIAKQIVIGLRTGDFNSNIKI